MPVLSLSIITPTLNSAATLPATLLSVRPLVAVGAQHIVVDSGSTDGTAELALESGAQVIQFPKGNMYAAINAGIAQSRGKWVTYINGDDVLWADATNESLEFFASSADVIYGNLDYIDAHGRFLFGWRSPSPRHLGWLMRHYCPFPQQGTLIRREVFEALSGFNAQFRYSADYDFFARACAAGHRFRKYARKSVAGFRLMPTQLSQAQRDQMVPEGKKVRARLAAGRSAAQLLPERFAAAAYRTLTNLDSRYLRKTRGQGLDRR